MTTDPDRRKFIQAIATLAMTGGMLLPAVVTATPSEAKAKIKEITNAARLNKGRVKITVPVVADHGGRVDVTVTADSPMTEADHVKAIHVISDNNPFPEVVTFSLGPDAGKAEISFYMRMAKTQNVYAVVEMSDGSFHIDKGTSTVTIGGCD